jgi:predicted acetyltransferase
MDELKLVLSTKLMKGIVTKLISKAIYKKFGYHIDIQLNEIEADMKDGKVHFHANVDAELSNEDFMKILKFGGLD